MLLQHSGWLMHGALSYALWMQEFIAGADAEGVILCEVFPD